MLRLRCWLFLLLAGGGWAEEDGRTLSETVARLVEVQAQMHSAGVLANLTLPNGFNDVLVVRRTIAADWQRRLAAAAVRADDPDLVRFTGELAQLVSGLQTLVGLAINLGDASRRYPHCQDEPAFARYRSLAAETYTQGLQALIKGRPYDQIIPVHWYRREERLTMLLGLIESAHVADERYAALPRDDRLRIEYREHLLLTRTTLERTLDLQDDREGHHLMEVHHAYARVLDLRVELAQRIADCGLPAEAPEVQMFRQIGDQRVASLTRQVALARVRDAEDDDEHQRRIEQEHRVLARAERFGDFADQWLGLARERQQGDEYVTELLEDAPAELAARTRALLDETRQACHDARMAFVKAVTADDLAAALAAKQAAERANQLTDRRLRELDFDIDIANREQAWRTHAKDPAIAEKMREWDTRRGELLARRKQADEAFVAAMTAIHAEERAALMSEEASERSRSADEALDLHDLQDLFDALEEMVDLRAGPEAGK
jgi:hypothetical protein